MKKVCYNVHLTNGKILAVVECFENPDDVKERFPQWFAEAQLTGVLITGTTDTFQFLVPMENVLFVERIPNYGEEEEEDKKHEE